MSLNHSESVLILPSKIILMFTRRAIHQLSNERWALNVSGNWRLTFEFIDGDVFVLDYEDYH